MEYIAVIDHYNHKLIILVADEGRNKPRGLGEAR